MKKKKSMRYAAFMITCMCVVLSSCKQSNPEDVLLRQGDVVNFSGRKWDVKSSSNQVGPGPNYFSKLYEDVWVDERGFLHLNIANRNGLWYSTEVISQDTMGYGTYTWTIQADPMSFASNVVLGLFTWDNNTFFSQANSEVDIELSKWGTMDSQTPLTYSVQPVNFGPYYAERSKYANTDPDNLLGVTTHEFTWTDTLITWRSWRGTIDAPQSELSSWSFDLNHPARIKYEGGQASNPVVIPAPGNTTNARMNFWTLPHIAIGPENGLEHEVVIREFRYRGL